MAILFVEKEEDFSITGQDSVSLTSAMSMFLPLTTKNGKLELSNAVDVFISNKGFVCAKCRKPKKNKKTIRYVFYSNGVESYCKTCGKEKAKELQKGKVPVGIFNLSFSDVDLVTKETRKLMLFALTGEHDFWLNKTPLSLFLMQAKRILNNTMPLLPETLKETIMYLFINRLNYLNQLRHYSNTIVHREDILATIDIPCPVTLNKLALVSYSVTSSGLEIKYTSPSMYGSSYVLKGFRSLTTQ